MVADDISPEKAIVALLALAVAEREERIDPDLVGRKTETILAEAGLSYGQISAVTGKKPDAVRMAVTRAKKESVKQRRSDTLR
jgi:DNA-directed RNA polymerase specialized sigma24 family protein